MTPAVAAYLAADLLTGIILNVGLLFAGLSLSRYREWGRKATLWLAGAKIVRLWIMYSIGLSVLTPAYCRALAASLRDRDPQTPAASVMEAVVMQGVLMTVYGLAAMLLAMVYPAICLWLLRRPSVKSACHAVPPAASMP